MGHYTGFAYKFKVKKDTPQEVLQLLTRVTTEYHNDSDYDEAFAQYMQSVGKLTTLTDGHIHELHSTFTGGSAYFKAWGCFHTPQSHSFQDGLFKTYASCKDRIETGVAVQQFLNFLLPYIECVDGDVLCRTIYEEGIQEQVYYYDQGKNEVVKGKGFKYKFHYAPIDDYRHPRGFTTDPEEFVPPNNIHELNK